MTEREHPSDATHPFTVGSTPERPLLTAPPRSPDSSMRTTFIGTPWERRRARSGMDVQEAAQEQGPELLKEENERQLESGQETSEQEYRREAKGRKPSAEVERVEERVNVSPLLRTRMISAQAEISGGLSPAGVSGIGPTTIVAVPVIQRQHHVAATAPPTPPPTRTPQRRARQRTSEPTPRITELFAVEEKQQPAPRTPRTALHHPVEEEREENQEQVQYHAVQVPPSRDAAWREALEQEKQQQTFAMTVPPAAALQHTQISSALAMSPLLGSLPTTFGGDMQERAARMAWETTLVTLQELLLFRIS
jgi:hypothetical protein